jgi:hypothetical protein
MGDVRIDIQVPARQKLIGRLVVVTRIAQLLLGPFFFSARLIYDSVGNADHV